MSKRDEKITEAISLDGFEYKGQFYKAMTIASLLQLERLKSPYAVGGDQLRSLVDLLYMASHDVKEVRKMTIEQWDDVVSDYADTLTLTDLQDLGELIRNRNDVDAATIILPKEDTGKKK